MSNPSPTKIVAETGVRPDPRLHKTEGEGFEPSMEEKTPITVFETYTGFLRGLDFWL